MPPNDIQEIALDPVSSSLAKNLSTPSRPSILDAKHDDPRFDGAWKAKTRLLALEHGLTLHSEPFGRSGTCIDVWQGDVKLGYRKSWKAAYALAKQAIPLTSTK